MQDLCCLTFMQDTAQYLTKPKKKDMLYISGIHHSFQSQPEQGISNRDKQKYHLHTRARKKGGKGEQANLLES
jgi:hypothetical protein